MKVLVIPSWYPSKSYPNNGIFFKEQVEALKKHGIDVEVLCIDIPYRKTKKDFKYFVKNVYTENDIKIHRYVLPLSFLHRLPKLYYAFLEWFSKRIYKRFLKDQRYNVIHAHSFLLGGYVALQLSAFLKCKCFITEHTSKILTNSLNSVEKTILKKCVEQSDAFICVSNNLKKQVQMLTDTSEKILVYPNLVNSKFSFSGEKNKKEFLVTSIGNLIPLKRMDLLIEAFCKAFTKEENIKLAIIGMGIERDKLQKIVEQYEREQQIVLCGQLTRKEVGEILFKSHVMALLSEKETFGVAYVEALASGNVIIGVDNGGANDIVTKQNGVIAHYSDTDEIAKTLRCVYENYSLYSPMDISKEAVEKYGEFEFGSFYKKLFDSVD